MVISTLTLSHFRSHETLRLRLDAGPVAIFGPNGAGKTNILEAVSMLSPGRGLHRATPETLARQPDMVGWKVAAEITASDQKHEVETWAAVGEARQVRIDGKAATQSALGRILRILWLVPAMDRLWIEGAEVRRRFLDRMVLSLFPDHAEVSLAYEKAMRERNRLLRDEVSDAGWYAALEAQMGEAAVLIAANRDATLSRLTDAQHNAATVFPVANLQLVWPDQQPEPMELSSALAASRRRDMAAGRTLLGPHRADLSAIYAAKALPAEQCSTGEQKALLISLLLANSRALAAETGAAPVLLLDEVAAHLDEGRRAALYDEILTLGAQALMTGTGPELFQSLGPRARWLRVTERNGLSQAVEATS